MFQDLKSHLDALFSDIKEYLIIRQNLFKLMMVEKVSGAASAVMSGAILFGIFLLCILFISLALAYIIAYFTGELYIGFSAMALFYLLILLILYKFRNKLMIDPFRDAMIRNMMKEKEEEEA
jgi:hypothetical protein